MILISILHQISIIVTKPIDETSSVLGVIFTGIIWYNLNQAPLAIAPGQSNRVDVRISALYGVLERKNERAKWQCNGNG